MQNLPLLFKSKAAILHILEQKTYIYYVDAAGRLYRYDTQTAHNQLIVDGSTWLILDEEVSLYAYKNYVAVVNIRQVYGFVYDTVADETALFMKRGDYQVEHCSFALAFLQIEGRDCCLHGTDWNRLDIYDLKDKRYLTDRDEENHHFDYFHSLLYMSPDAQHFAVNGWHWSPYDMIYTFKIGDFLEKYELAHQAIEHYEHSGYNWDRPFCWVDNQTVALIFGNKEAGNDEGDKLIPFAYILPQNLNNELLETIPILDEVLNQKLLNKEYEPKGRLFYHSAKSYFIIATLHNYWAVLDKTGKLIFADDKQQLIDYKPEANLCLLQNIAGEFSLFSPAKW